jgi:PAP2 superfamily
VINIELSWQQAAAASAAVGCVSAGLGVTRRPRLVQAAVFARETSLVVGLFALWQLAGSFTVLGRGGAVPRSRWIWHIERVLRLPSETSLQRIFLPHPLLVQFFNVYYDSLHFPVLIACMIWLFVRHRDGYRQLRTTLVALTGVCLLIQLIPVAPPRMLPATGMVDTGVLYHQSVYANVGGFNPDQLSAMPSVHVGWAILVAVAVIGNARSHPGGGPPAPPRPRWRWLAVTYPVMTSVAVVVTANHFWLDGIVAAALLVIVLGAQAACRRLLVAHHHAHAGGQDRGQHGELARADDRAAQRLGVDDDAELGTAQVGAVHPGPGEIGSGQL